MRELSPEERVIMNAIDETLAIRRWSPFPLLRHGGRRGLALGCAKVALHALRRLPMDEPYKDDDSGAGVREPRRPSPQAPDDEVGPDEPAQG